MNAGNKNTFSMHQPRKRNVTTSVVGLENGHIRKHLAKIGEPQRYSWEKQKKDKEEEEEEEKKKKKKKRRRTRRRRRGR